MKSEERIREFSFQASSEASQNIISDNELWTKFLEGDQGAFAQIYKEYVNDLYNFGFQLCRNREVSKDIIHDVFMSLRFSKSKSKIKSIKSYLFRCFYTEWIKRSKKESNLSSLSDCFAITASFEDRLIEKQIGATKIKYLRQALKSLTVKQRKGIMLFFYEKMSYDEVAEAMTLRNAKSARKLIYRALDRLKPTKTFMKILFSFHL